MYSPKSYNLCITSNEIVQNSKSKPKKFSYFCTLKVMKVYLWNEILYFGWFWFAKRFQHARKMSVLQSKKERNCPDSLKWSSVTWFGSFKSRLRVVFIQIRYKPSNREHFNRTNRGKLPPRQILILAQRNSNYYTIKQ